MKDFVTRTLIALTLVLPATQIHAQDTIYPVKFVCGFESGTIPFLNQFNADTTLKYEELKPGNYATVINVANITLMDQRFQLGVAIKFNGVAYGPAFIPSPDGTIDHKISALNTCKVGCPEIINILVNTFNLPLTGQAVEGTLFVLSDCDPLDVTSVYTYASQNAFQEHLVWGLQDGFIRLLFNLPYFPFTPPPFFEIPFQGFEIAASGAGGMGLGASIDVEHIEGRCLKGGTPPIPGQ